MIFKQTPLLLLSAILACGSVFAKSGAPPKSTSSNAGVEQDAKIIVTGADKIWLQNIIKQESSGVAAIVALKAILPQSFHVFATKSVELGMVVTWDQGTAQNALQQIMGQLKAYYILPGDGSFTVYPGKQPIVKVTPVKKARAVVEEPAIDQEQLQVNKALIEKIRERLNAP